MSYLIMITHGWWPWWHRAIIGNNHLNIFSFLYYHNYALLSATPSPASTNHTNTAQNYWISGVRSYHTPCKIEPCINISCKCVVTTVLKMSVTNLCVGEVWYLCDYFEFPPTLNFKLANFLASNFKSHS